MLALEPSLLITDDDRAMRETLRDVFERRGFRTWLAEDGEQAVQIAAQKPVHLALLDMHMPRLCGLDAIRQLKQTHRLIPCILFTGALDDAILEEAARIDVFSVLSKPISFAQITGLVGQAMRSTYDWYK